MSERHLEQLDKLSNLFEKVTDDAVATLKELDIARLQIADLKARLADANRGAQINASVNKSLAGKLKLAVEALSDARSNLFAIYNGDWPFDISPTPAGFAQFAVNDIDRTLAKIKEPAKGMDL